MARAMRSMSLRSRTPPVGFWGEFRYDEFGAIGDQRGQFVDVEREIALLAQLNRNRPPADIVDHRLINREAGIGIDDFIPFVNQRQYREENDWLTAGNNHHFLGRDLDPAGAAYVFGDGLAKFGQSRGGAIMRPTFVQSVDGGFDYVRGSVEIGLADFQVDDVFALALQGPRLVQNFESRLRAQARHAARELQFVLCGG